jgi:hypothetical protein
MKASVVPVSGDLHWIGYGSIAASGELTVLSSIVTTDSPEAFAS